METLLHRAVATGVPVDGLIKVLVNSATPAKLENVHPLQGGILRLKHPSVCRPGVPRERFHLLAAVRLRNAQQTCRHCCNDRAPPSDQVYHHATQPLECTRTPRSNRVVTTRRRRSIYSPT
jgi:hypothetical protein